MKSLFVLAFISSLSSAAEFKQSAFNFKAFANTPFQLNFNDLLKEPSVHASFSEPSFFSEWLKYSPQGLISGIPKDEHVLTIVSFNLLVTEGDVSDTAKITIDVGASEKPGPTWLESPIRDQACVGQTFVSNNWGDMVMDFSGALVLNIEFIDPPKWLKRVGTEMKAHAVGKPTKNEIGKHIFMIRANTEKTFTDNKVIIVVREECL